MRNLLIPALVAAGVALVGCASETSTEAPSTLTSEAALSKANAALVGAYHSADGALYPTFTLQADGTYSWDTGIRCVRAPCPSGDTGRWFVYSSGGTKYVDLASNDPSIDDRWFKGKTSPGVTLKGVFGTPGQFTQVKACGPDDWQTIIDTQLGQVEGTWTRHSQVGVTVTDETLHLHADYDYQLTKTIGPGCDAQGHCAKFVTRVEQSSGTFALNPGQGVQLVPSAPAADDLALSWILQKACGGDSVRLASTETNVDVFLSPAAQCQTDADCEPGDAPVNTRLCAIGLSVTLTCNTTTNKCENVCAPTKPTCAADEQLCAQCGAPPPDGVCTSFGCYPASQTCPLFP